MPSPKRRLGALGKGGGTHPASCQARFKLGAGPGLHRVTCAGVLQIRAKPLESDLNQLSRDSPDYLPCKQGLKLTRRSAHVTAWKTAGGSRALHRSKGRIFPRWTC